MEGSNTPMSETRDDKRPGYPTEAQGPIPAFESYEEAAEWWDTHDTGAPEFAAAFTPVEVRSTRNFTKQLMFRADEAAGAGAAGRRLAFVRGGDPRGCLLGAPRGPRRSPS